MARSRRRRKGGSGGRWRLTLALTALVLALDQLTKWAVRQAWAGLPREFTDGLRLELTFNSGISFSQLSDRGSLVLVLVALVVVAVCVALVLSPSRYRPTLGVVLGGAVGNLIDRLRFDGAVVDFIGIYGYPSFNIADIAIVGGTILLVFKLLRSARE